jgi:hypothetical protein
VSKRELHRFQIPMSLKIRKRQGRQRLIRFKKASSPEAPEAMVEGKQEVESEPNGSALVPVPKRRSPTRFWQWTLVWLSLLAILGITALTSAVWLLTKLPPPIDCRRISPLSVDGDRLYCARVAAQSGKLEQLVAAIALVQDWPPQHPLYTEAQHQMDAWSRAILAIAQQKLRDGNLSQAIVIAGKIPKSSPLYTETQAKITVWKQQLERTEEISRQFQQALKTQEFSKASQLVAQLSQVNQEPWNLSRVDALLKQLSVEKEAWEQLEEARKLAQTNGLEQIQKAIALTTEIAPQTYVHPQALKEQAGWSRTLVNVATGFFKQQSFAGAIRTLEQIPTTAPQYSEAQDWIQLNRAAQTAKKDTILAIVDALAALRSIAPQSPVQPTAAAQAKLWQSQLKDLSHLQAAKVLANVQQRTSLNSAIDQAAKIALGRPQRQRAQTLIAQWRKEIEQIDDRNRLRSAQLMAQGGTLVELKAAVELASEVKLGQPLRIEAQTEIAKWNRQIQALEDRPILDLAEALAQRRDLIAAISTAGQIRADRPLYPEAQKAIANWVAQVQTAQDRPILDAATALAAQGRFDVAIATASQIPPDRALYTEAQAAISRWRAQQANPNGDVQSAPLEDVQGSSNGQ